jgi:signal transduction histidine kinase
MNLLARLRWGALGLRGRVVGAVVLTSVITLAVAAVVLLPRLEGSLRNAALTTLRHDVDHVRKQLKDIEGVQYATIALLPDGHLTKRQRSSPTYQEAYAAQTKLFGAENSIKQYVGASYVGLYGDISQGRGKLITGHRHLSGAAVISAGAQAVAHLPNSQPPSPGSLDDVSEASSRRHDVYSIGTIYGRPVARAAIWLDHDDVLVIRKSIDEIPGAVSATRHAFEIAAVIAIVLMLMLAVPVAGTLVRRLQRLREVALRISLGGSGMAVEFPADRARDEVGDLARSFSIMHRRLRQQEQARRGFVATASHELRTPLASLNGMLELLEEDLKSPNPDLEDAGRLLERARAQSLRLSRLAADLLDLSRLDAEVELRSEPLELGEMVRAVLAEFEISSHELGVDTVLRDDGDQVWATADPGSVARILRILLDNGLRVSPRGTQIAVTVSAGEQPTLSVTDQGPGVAPEERALIFERFKRGTETGGQAGFGLGLAIGRELAERMGGTLVLSDSGGPGATFTLALPGALAHAEEPQEVFPGG